MVRMRSTIPMARSPLESAHDCNLVGSTPLTTMAIPQSFQACLTEAISRSTEPSSGSLFANRSSAVDFAQTPAPSPGGTSLLNLLQIAEAKNIRTFRMNSADYAQIMIESSRLAGIDSRTYIGDPDFDGHPPADLVSADYAEQRAKLVQRNSSVHPVKPGKFKSSTAQTIDPTYPQDQTSQIVVVDAQGDALSMTTTVNNNFGARVLARGMVLNNANSNYSVASSSVNEMESDNRPRTTIAPTIGFNSHGSPTIVVRSAGGAPIHDYIAQAVLGIEAYDLSPAQALALPHLSGQTRIINCDGRLDYALEVESGTEAESVLPNLRQCGAACAQKAILHRGTGAISVGGDCGIRGAANPRREGAAFGD